MSSNVDPATRLLVATFKVHLPYGFSSIKIQTVTAAGAQFGQPGYETDLLYLACLAALVVGGSGPFAVDGLRARLRRAGNVLVRYRAAARSHLPFLV
jgi:putative oxidoreductase